MRVCACVYVCVRVCVCACIRVIALRFSVLEQCIMECCLQFVSTLHLSIHCILAAEPEHTSSPSSCFWPCSSSVGLYWRLPCQQTDEGNGKWMHSLGWTVSLYPFPSLCIVPASLFLYFPEWSGAPPLCCWWWSHWGNESSSDRVQLSTWLQGWCGSLLLPGSKASRYFNIHLA